MLCQKGSSSIASCMDSVKFCQGSFTNYVDRFLAFFDPPTHSSGHWWTFAYPTHLSTWTRHLPTHPIGKKFGKKISINNIFCLCEVSGSGSILLTYCTKIPKKSPRAVIFDVRFEFLSADDQIQLRPKFMFTWTFSGPNHPPQWT